MHVITIPGKPLAQKRARTVRKRGQSCVFTYNPQKFAKQRIQLLIKSQLPGAFEPLSKCDIEILFKMPMPSSWSKKKQIDMDECASYTKPDIDNLVKFILDCLSRIAIKDDARISSIQAKKEYSMKPETIIEIYGV